ncbi:MAG: hypothetical protein HYZ89_05850 [Candidatus Omnitrophica bacterium]|nr:hypothetical protein [Candidatus Omnitrophota bacterium]
MRLAAYDCGHQTLLVEAARGRASTKRLGFLQTALVPTVELESVTVTWVHDDGAQEQAYLPAAVIDWTKKTLLAASGTTLVRPHPTPRSSLRLNALQHECQG